MSQKIRETRLAPFDMQSGDGYPDHISRLGSFYFDNLTGIQYQNKNGISNWSQFFDGDNRPIDIYVTGGTYDYTSGIATFVNNTGGTFTLFGFNVGGGGGGVFTGGTIVGGANFLAGLTSTTITTNSISATTYYNLPTDIRVTGGTYSNGTATFTNNTGGTFTVTGLYTGYTVPIDIYVTGGTYDTGSLTLTNNTGGTFNVTGFSTSTATEFTGGTVTGSTNFTGGLTANTISATTYFNLPIDVRVTGGTGNDASKLYTFTNNTGGTFSVSALTDIRVTGGTYSAGTAVFANNTGGTFSVTGFSTGSTNTTTTVQFTGGTVTGATNFINGLTANTISATTYFNLPIDIRTTGATYFNNTFTYTNNTGGTYNTLFNTVSGLTVNGNLTVTGTTSSPTFTGNSIILSNSASTISLNNTTRQQIRFFSGGTGTPTLNTYSDGAKIILSDNISSIGSGVAIGVSTGAIWYGTDLPGNSHDWYAGSTRLMNLSSSGGLRLFGLGGPTTTAMVLSGTSVLGSKGGVGYMDFLQVTNNWSGATNPNKWFRTNSTGGLEILNSVYTASTLTLSDNGILYVGGGAIGTTTSSDGTSNYLSFNGNNSQIYDDGNMHIHSRSTGQSMWINTNGGGINLGTQSPVSGGGIASSINCGTGSVTGYFNINTGRTFTDSRAYGYLSTGGAGTYGGGSQSVTVSLYATSRIWGQEIDAFSDERMKDIQGEVTLGDGLKLINNLKPIKYTWKSGEDKGLKVGYSAQQVSKSGFDHLVALIPREGLEETIDGDGFVSPKDTQFSMNYDQVIPYHGVVIKHLLEKILELEKQIQELKNK